MPAPVIANDAIMPEHRRHLAVPHVQRGAERVAEHQHRLACVSLHLVVDRTAVRLDGGHRLSPDLVLYFARGFTIAAPGKPDVPGLSWTAGFGRFGAGRGGVRPRHA